MHLRTIMLLAIATLSSVATANELTLEQIMDDPDWLGNQPENAFWGPDSRTAYFTQEQQGSKLNDVFAVDTSDGAIAQVAEQPSSLIFLGSNIFDLGNAPIPIEDFVDSVRACACQHGQGRP